MTGELAGPQTRAEATNYQETSRHADVMRFVADLGGWDRSLNNITIGESGQFLSRHYKDQWDAYYTGRSFPMQFERVDAKSTLVVQPAPPANPNVHTRVNGAIPKS